MKCDYILELLKNKDADIDGKLKDDLVRAILEEEEEEEVK